MCQRFIPLGIGPVNSPSQYPWTQLRRLHPNPSERGSEGGGKGAEGKWRGESAFSQITSKINPDGTFPLPPDIHLEKSSFKVFGKSGSEWNVTGQTLCLLPSRERPRTISLLCALFTKYMQRPMLTSLISKAQSYFLFYFFHWSLRELRA